MTKHEVDEQRCKMEALRGSFRKKFNGACSTNDVCISKNGGRSSMRKYLCRVDYKIVLLIFFVPVHPPYPY